MRTPPKATCEDSGRVVKRDQRRKLLILCALLLIGALLGLGLLAFTITRGLETCNTAECHLLLERLLAAHNDTIDPCEDFFSYACGNWKANHTQGIKVPLTNVFDVLLEENQLIMKSLLEEPQLGVSSNTAKQKAVWFYHSCLDTRRIDALGAQPLKKLINEIGGWNITGSWKESDFNQTLQILMGKYNTFPFFKAYVGPSSSDPSTNIIQIDHPEFELPPDTHFKTSVDYPKVLRSYLVYLMKLGSLLGGHSQVTSIYSSLALSFITNLQKAITPLKTRQEKRTLFYHTTIGELQEEAPAIDWLSCLQAAFHPVQLNFSQPIAVHDMDYLKSMSRLIGEWQNRRDVLQIYMILCLVGNLSPALDRHFQEARQELSDKLYGRTIKSEMVRTERWRKCLSETSMFFGPILGEMVIQEIFPQKTKELAEQMFSEIRDAFHNHLDQVKWMDKQAHQEAKQKIYNLSVEIGYPENLLQTSEVDQEYQELEIYDDSFFHNVVASLKSLRNRLLLSLVNPHLPDSWEVVPWSVHSYYSLRRHAVVFPAGMFRSPFFHTEFPSAVNFGAMGFFMAHELLHSFYYYVLPKNCSACDTKVLAEGIDCLVKQYESYSLKGHSINGSFTFPENAADTGGLAIAYQTMCGHQNLEELQDFLRRDPHSPPPLRVLGSLSNSQDFSRHFKCPSKSPMNPALKCRIW
ncbi:kell blood group glycoprotein isoform X2 [Tiliqua scincoides]|uniref:kell blood group glycoprotein isoform X2 n=1 Tax=Tiliqua scincoides TaxID=71010 RepID=UPI0034629619